MATVEEVKNTPGTSNICRVIKVTCSDGTYDLPYKFAMLIPLVKNLIEANHETEVDCQKFTTNDISSLVDQFKEPQKIVTIDDYFGLPRRMSFELFEKLSISEIKKMLKNIKYNLIGVRELADGGWTCACEVEFIGVKKEVLIVISPSSTMSAAEMEKFKKSPLVGEHEYDIWYSIDGGATHTCKESLALTNEASEPPNYVLLIQTLLGLEVDYLHLKESMRDSTLMQSFFAKNVKILSE